MFLRAMENGQEKRLTAGKDPEMDAAWSPDGKRLAFTFDKTVPNQGDLDIHSIGADGDDQRPALVSPGKLSQEEWPSWSPDGQWLAITSTFSVWPWSGCWMLPCQATMPSVRE